MIKNKQEFIKKMAIAQESFQAIESFYGKMKANPHQKVKFINSIKKEINKISRIKDVSLQYRSKISALLNLIHIMVIQNAEKILELCTNKFLVNSKCF